MQNAGPGGMKAYLGVLIALLVIGAWLTMLLFLLNSTYGWSDALSYGFILLQMHLFTGLFITAHDAMHGTVSSHAGLNKWIGYVSVFLYAGFYYPQVRRKHHMHHNHVHTAADPDYHAAGFWPWYFSFMKNYISWHQLLIMALAYNLLQLVFPQEKLWLFWVIPNLLSTLQLFYFGTYLPHRGLPKNKHRANTLSKNHFLAFISCYFFGYHYEHHDKPQVPWWQLYKHKQSAIYD